MNNETTSDDFPIKEIQKVISSFRGFRFDVWELINEVWLLGRVQKVTDLKYLPKRIRYDILDIIRAANELRKKHKITVTYDDLLAETFGSSKSIDLILIDQADTFEFFTKDLSTRQKEAIYQVFWYDKSQREAATAMGITQSAVCCLLKNAIKKIKENHGKEQYDLK